MDINLVSRVVPVIRQEDPQGKIMLAGTTYLFEPGAREYHAGEISWWTHMEPQAQDPGVWYSDIAAAKYHARGIVMHLGMDVSVTNGATPSGFPSRRYADFVIKNLCTIMAGARATNLPVEIETEAMNLRSNSFSLPNGDFLVALWTDGVAIEDDPGISATLTLPSFSAGKVMGMDVLFGYGQQIQAINEDGNLVVHGLLIKDYPIILRFTNTKSP